MGQLRGPAGESLHGDAHPGDDDAPFIRALPQVGQGGGGAHVDDDDGLGILLQGRHGGGHNVRPQLVVDLGQDIHPGLHPRPHDHGPHPAELADGVGHGPGHGRDHAGDHRPRHIPNVRLIQLEHVQQVNGNLIPGFILIGLDGTPELEHALRGVQTHGHGGVADVNR